MAETVVELALEALERRRATVETEIDRVRKQLGRGARRTTTAVRRAVAGRVGGKRRRRSAASRRAQSLKMKAYWAKKRGEKKPKK